MDRSTAGRANVFPKYKIPVRIRFNDETIVLGTVFVRQGQRVLDMICDERPFFPVAMTTGITLVNKMQIRQVDVMGVPEREDTKDPQPGFDLSYIENNA